MTTPQFPKVLKTKRGTDMLLDDNYYAYTIRGDSLDGSLLFWGCAKRGKRDLDCRARFRTKTRQHKYEIVEWSKEKHTHPPMGVEIAAQIVRQRIKRRALSTPMNPTDIINYELAGLDSAIVARLANRSSLGRAIRNWRQKAGQKNERPQRTYKYEEGQTDPQDRAKPDDKISSSEAAVQELLNMEFNLDPVSSASPARDAEETSAAEGVVYDTFINTEDNTIYVYQDDDGIIREINTNREIGTIDDTRIDDQIDECAQLQFEHSTPKPPPKKPVSPNASIKRMLGNNGGNDSNSPIIIKRPRLSIAGKPITLSGPIIPNQTIISSTASMTSSPLKTGAHDISTQLNILKSNLSKNLKKMDNLNSIKRFKNHGNKNSPMTFDQQSQTDSEFKYPVKNKRLEQKCRDILKNAMCGFKRIVSQLEGAAEILKETNSHSLIKQKQNENFVMTQENSQEEFENNSDNSHEHLTESESNEYLEVNADSTNIQVTELESNEHQEMSSDHTIEHVIESKSNEHQEGNSSDSKVQNVEFENNEHPEMCEVVNSESITQTVDYGNGTVHIIESTDISKEMIVEVIGTQNESDETCSENIIIEEHKIPKNKLELPDLSDFNTEA